ncbi:hypothetical protein ACRALDRAFT_212380 [Sodiomyces alcalophilus JCM 7366]|uniref:uncharacterized protein n=1 Tax=Sodiomyces alcalophilus JCM 7366 TaxID=591952 RepID=UPI0039B3B27D
MVLRTAVTPTVRVAHMFSFAPSSYQQLDPMYSATDDDGRWMARYLPVRRLGQGWRKKPLMKSRKWHADPELVPDIGSAPTLLLDEIQTDYQFSSWNRASTDPVTPGTRYRSAANSVDSYRVTSCLCLLVMYALSVGRRVELVRTYKSPFPTPPEILYAQASSDQLPNVNEPIFPPRIQFALEL